MTITRRQTRCCLIVQNIRRTLLTGDNSCMLTIPSQTEKSIRRDLLELRVDVHQLRGGLSGFRVAVGDYPSR
jgi:hypothetical protein